MSDSEPMNITRRVHFTAAMDIKLLELTISENPFKNPKIWDYLGDPLRECYGRVISGRTCRERVLRLLKAHKSMDAKSLKKSGAEEDYEAKTYLLTQIAELEHEAMVSKNEKQSKKHLDEEKEKAKEVRAAALETGKKQKRNVVHDESTEAVAGTSAEAEMGPMKPLVKRRRSSEEATLEFLERKCSRDAEIHKQNLELRRQELELMREERMEMRKIIDKLLDRQTANK